MKKSSALVNVEGNKDSNINITIGQVDELSCDNIRRNCEDVVALEEEFSDRLEYSKDVLTKKLLPKALQSDFEIVPRYIGNKVEYETKPTTLDAYEKFPMRINYTMQFKNQEEARKFRKSGIEDLLKKAEELQQPIEIPNITNMKEFIGEFEDPAGYANKHGSDGIKLYICPSPLPPAQKYKIEVFNSKASFTLETSLRLKGRHNDKVILTNNDSKEEAFDVIISLTGITESNSGELMEGKFNITISLRVKYASNCECNKELIKFRFLADDSNNHIIINNIESGINIFTFEKCGKTVYKTSDYKKFNKLIELIEKVIYISKIKEVNIKYDLDDFVKNEELINLLYNETNDKKYIIKKKMHFNYIIPKNKQTEEFCKIDKPFYVISELGYILLSGEKVELKPNKLELKDCLLTVIKQTKKKYEIKLESSNITFTPQKN